MAVLAWLGGAVPVRVAPRGWASQGAFWCGCFGAARRGAVRHGPLRCGSYGTARRGEARSGVAVPASQFWFRSGVARQSRLGPSSCGLAGHGRHGKAVQQDHPHNRKASWS